MLRPRRNGWLLVTLPILTCSLLLLRGVAQEGFGSGVTTEGAHETVDIGPHDDFQVVLADLPPGATVRLAAGIYHLDAPLQFERPVTLLGAGRDSTRIVSTSERVAVSYEGDGTLTIEDLTFSHEGGSWANVLVVRRGEVMIRDGAFTGGVARWYWEEVNEGPPAGVSWDEVMQDRGYGLLLLNDARAEVTSTTFNGNGWAGIAVFGRSSALLEGNHGSSNEGFGFYFADDATGTVSNNRLEANTFSGIVVEHQARPTLSGNTILNNNAFGIFYSSASGGEARNNIIENNGFDGVGVLDMAAPTLADNTIRGNERSGIYYDMQAAGVARKNLIEANVLAGVALLGEASPTLDGNTIIGNGNAGLFYLGDSGGEARNNRIGGNALGGVGVLERSHPFLVGNAIRGNEGEGIAFGGSATGTARDNVIEDNWGPGIDVQDQARPTLLDNTLRGNQETASAFEVSEATGLIRIPLEAAMQAPAAELASSYHAIRYARLMADVVRSHMGATTAQIGLETQVVVTVDNVDVVLTELEDRLATYGRAIERRGYEFFQGIYDTEVTAGCDALGFSAEESAIEQEGFEFWLAHGPFQDDMRHIGVTVESAVVIEHAFDPDIELWGVIEEGRIELGHGPSGCRIVLIPRW